MPIPSSKTSRKSVSGRRPLAAGSQFRSRDVFPQAAAAIAMGCPSALGDEIHAQALPPPPSSVIAYVDGYENIKTTIAYNDKIVTP